MVCSVLKPNKDEPELVNKVIRVAKRVDVVVLDWNLNSDNGSSTIEIIKSLLNADTPPRLRLIFIYTGENKSSIVDDVLHELKDKANVEFENWEEKNGLKIGHTLITIFVKKGVSSEFSIEPEELPQKIIEEFTKIYSGLIPSAALKSIGILRDNTHNLLGTLKSELDPPYLSHRALLPQPEEAEQHILEIIGLEIQSLLKNCNADFALKIEQIKNWLDHFNLVSTKKLVINGSESFTEIKIPEPLTNQLVLEWLQEGLEKTLIPKTITNKNERKIFNDNCHLTLTNLFCNDQQDAVKLDNDFSIITSLKTYYKGQIPKLSLGAIVREKTDKNDAEYWLCVQPKCDGVRIQKNRSFLFLKLIKVKTDFHFIVKDFDEYVFLFVDYSLYNIMQRKFKAKDGVILAESNTNNEFYFQICDGGNKYYWIAELKDTFAQRIVNRLSAHMSRVGLDESEWLRRSAKS